MSVRYYRRRRVFKKALPEKQKKVIKHMIDKAIDLNIEDKYITQDFAAGFNMIQGGTIFMVDVPTLGTSVSQRTGDVIRLKRFEMRYNIDSPVNADAITRVIVGQWRSKSPTSPTIPDILVLNSNTLLASVESLYNDVLKSSYKILYDKTHDASSVNGFKYKHVTISNKLIKKLEINPGSTVAYNQIFMIIISNTPPANYPVIHANIRTYFEDA